MWLPIHTRIRVNHINKKKAPRDIERFVTRLWYLKYLKVCRNHSTYDVRGIFIWVMCCCSNIEITKQQQKQAKHKGSKVVMYGISYTCSKYLLCASPMWLRIPLGPKCQPCEIPFLVIKDKVREILSWLRNQNEIRKKKRVESYDNFSWKVYGMCGMHHQPGIIIVIFNFRLYTFSWPIYFSCITMTS